MSSSRLAFSRPRLRTALLAGALLSTAIALISLRFASAQADDTGPTLVTCSSTSPPVPYPIPANGAVVGNTSADTSDSSVDSMSGTSGAYILAQAPSSASPAVSMAQAESVATAPSFQGLPVQAELAIVTIPHVEIPTSSQGGPSSVPVVDHHLEWLVTYTFPSPRPQVTHGRGPSPTACAISRVTVIVDPTTGEGLFAIPTS